MYAIVFLEKGGGPMSSQQRIREIRNALGLSQAKFAEGISVSSGYLAGIELGYRKLNDRIVRLICVQYHVNEVWLRDGVGEMFIERSDARLEHIIRVFQGLRPEFQDYVLDQIDRLMELQKKQKP